MNTEVVSCLEEQGEISEEGTPGVDLERCTRTRTAESGHWNLHSPLLRLTVFKGIWFSWAQRDLMIHWGPGPQLLWREGEWKRALTAEPEERTLPRQRGFTKEKGKGSGAGPLLLGQQSQIYCCWYAAGVRISCPESLVGVVVSSAYLKMWHTPHTNLTATVPWFTAWNNSSSLDGYFKMQLSSRSFH